MYQIMNYEYFLAIRIDISLQLTAIDSKKYKYLFTNFIGKSNLKFLVRISLVTHVESGSAVNWPRSLIISFSFMKETALYDCY